MPTALQKLDPRYTVALRGFDDFGAAAAITEASASGFTVTGVFRDAADFAVLVLYDADDFFGHPRLKYLPDFSLAGLVLSFNVAYNGLQPLDSAKFPSIDWPYLDVIRTDGPTAQIKLFDHATFVSGNYTPASAVFTVAASPAVAFDRVTLWYQNLAFDYIAAGGESAAAVAGILAAAINAQTTDLRAVAYGASITVTAAKPGVDGNMITLYAQSKTGTLTLSPGAQQLSGGRSDATWSVQLDFTALGIDQVRQMWLTFAPAIQNGTAYPVTEWVAIFSNWNVADPQGKRGLKVAGRGSVRIEETDAWCTYLGSSWRKVDSSAGMWSRGFARYVSEIGDSVTVTYYCQSHHDLYLGTALFTDRGEFGVAVDGGPEMLLDCYLSGDAQVVARRLLQSSLPPGKHVVTLTLRAGTLAYFDFLEAAVRSDVPDPPGPWLDRAPAVDYDTDHGYKLPPARLLWMLQQLGYAGEIDLYVGVFWWMQKMRSGGSVPSVTIDFSQTAYTAGDAVFLNIGGAVYGKSVFPIDTASSIAAHFAYYVNEVAAGVWASVSGPVLTVTLRAVGPSYNFTFSALKNVTPLTFAGSLTGGTVSQWVIDPTQSQPLNVAARAWLLDFFSQCAAAGLGVCSAYSMELVNPPVEWVSQFPDGTQVVTATGFGTLNSSQCAPSNSGFLAYQVAVYLGTAALMQAAGLPVKLQCGEFLWWYFGAERPTTGGNVSGMAYYDTETKAAALAALGRPLHIYLTPNDPPNVIGYADANFLRNRLRDHVAAIVAATKAVYPAALFEVLYPYDVNYPTPAGAFNIGGQLNYYVNTPPEWKQPGTLDRIKVEALDRGASSRNLELAKQAMAIALLWGWPAGLVRYLYPVFNGGCPWEREQLAADGYRLAGLTPFAFDHVCLFGWPVEDPVIAPAAQVV